MRREMGYLSVAVEDNTSSDDSDSGDGELTNHSRRVPDGIRSFYFLTVTMFHHHLQLRTPAVSKTNPFPISYDIPPPPSNQVPHPRY